MNLSLVKSQPEFEADLSQQDLSPAHPIMAVVPYEAATRPWK